METFTFETYWGNCTRKRPWNKRIFEKGNCGILIENSNPEVIAKAITCLYKNQEELKKMGIKGRKIVEKFYTWDSMACEFEEFLKTLPIGVLKWYLLP